MKYKTTKKAVNAGYSTRIEVPYCDLQHLLTYKDPVAYTTRVEGWGADIYDFGNVAIVTGYAPFGNLRTSYKFRRKYDDAAREIVGNWAIPYKDKYAMVSELLDKFIDRCLDIKYNGGSEDGDI